MANTNNNTTTEKNKRIRHTTQKTESIFCHLFEVDHGTKDYPDKDGSYNVTLRMTVEEADRFRKMLSSEIEEAREFVAEKFDLLKPATRAKFPLGPTLTVPGVDEYDKETEEKTGNVLFRFKTKAIYKDRNGRDRKRAVPLFDAVLQPVKLTEEVGFGSLVKVSFTAAPYFVDGQAAGGLSLYLDAVQILKLNKFGERSAADYGFGEEEGFEASEIMDEEAEEGTTPPVGANSGDDEEF